MTALMTGPLIGGRPASGRRLPGAALADRLGGSALWDSVRDRHPGAQTVQLAVLGRPQVWAKVCRHGRGTAGGVPLEGVPGRPSGAPREGGLGGHRRRLPGATSKGLLLQPRPA